MGVMRRTQPHPTHIQTLQRSALLVVAPLSGNLIDLLLPSACLLWLQVCFVTNVTDCHLWLRISPGFAARQDTPHRLSCMHTITRASQCRCHLIRQARTHQGFAGKSCPFEKGHAAPRTNLLLSLAQHAPHHTTRHVVEVRSKSKHHYRGDSTFAPYQTHPPHPTPPHPHSCPPARQQVVNDLIHRCCQQRATSHINGFASRCHRP
jgi:hypothetical protein